MSFRPLLLAVPTALVAAASLAWMSPASALDDMADDPLELAQATPPAPPGPGAERARPERPAMSPRAVCADQVARRIGNRAYIKAKLDLKPEQMAAWNAFEKASDEANAKANARCVSLPTEMKERPNYIDRLTMQEEAMKARVASIEAVKPSLTALYNVLSSEQKAVFDRPHGRMGGHMHRMGGPGPR